VALVPVVTVLDRQALEEKQGHKGFKASQDNKVRQVQRVPPVSKAKWDHKVCRATAAHRVQ